MTYKFALSADDVSAVMGSLPAELQDPNTNGIVYEDPDLIVPDKHISVVQMAVSDLVNRRKQYLIGLAANARWKRENAGITSAGVPINTDDRSKQLVTLNRQIAEANPEYTTNWVGSDGEVYPVDAEKLKTMSNDLLTHVEECFKIFAEVREEIMSGDVTKPDQIVTAFTKPRQ